jgi:hypothetical protein
MMLAITLTAATMVETVSVCRKATTSCMSVQTAVSQVCLKMDIVMMLAITLIAAMILEIALVCLLPAS